MTFFILFQFCTHRWWTQDYSIWPNQAVVDATATTIVAETDGPVATIVVSSVVVVVISIVAAIMATATETAAEISIAIAPMAVHDSRMVWPTVIHQAANAMRTVELASPTTLTWPAMLPTAHHASPAMTHSSRMISTRAELNSIVHQLLSAQRLLQATTIRQLHTRPNRMGMTKLLIQIHRHRVVGARIISSTIPMDMAPLNHPIQCTHILLLRTMQSKRKPI